MSVSPFSSRSVGELFRSHVAEFGVLAWSDADEDTLIRLSSIGLPIKAVVTGTPACIPSCRNDLLTGPILAHFFLSRAARGRCDKQGAEGNPHRAQASRRQPEVCHRSADPRYVCWRSKHGLAARHTLCTPAKLTVDTLLDTRCARRRGVWSWFLQCGHLPMATNYWWCALQWLLLQWKRPLTAYGVCSCTLRPV